MINFIESSLDLNFVGTRVNSEDESIALSHGFVGFLGVDGVDQHCEFIEFGWHF